MKNKLTLITFCLLLTVNVTAQGRTIDVRPAGKELLEVNSREIAATSLRITNNTDTEYEFITDVKLPEGWLLITEDFPFNLRPNENITKPLSFFVPEATPPGTYKVIYSVRARKYPSIFDFYAVDVVVLPCKRLGVKLSEVPQCVIAGNEYQVSFLVTNGNAAENTISINVDSSGNVPFSLDGSFFSLPAGQSRPVTVTIKPQAELAGVLQYRLQLTAQIIQNGSPGSSANAAYSTEIIPCVTKADNLADVIALNAAIGRLNRKSKTAAAVSSPVLVKKQTLPEPPTQQEQKSYQPVVAAVPKILDKLIQGDAAKKKMLVTAIT